MIRVFSRLTQSIDRRINNSPVVLNTDKDRRNPACVTERLKELTEGLRGPPGLPGLTRQGRPGRAGTQGISPVPKPNGVDLSGCQELNHAYDMLNGARVQIRKDMLRVDTLYRNMLLSGNDAIQEIFASDARSVLNSRNICIGQIEEKLGKVDEGDFVTQGCLLAVAEDVINSTTHAHDELEKCRNLSIQKWSDAVARYNDIIETGRHFRDNNVTKKCCNEDVKVMAICIADQVLEMVPTFNELIKHVTNNSENLKATIILQLSECDQKPVIKAHTASVDASTTMKKCFGQETSNLKKTTPSV